MRLLRFWALAALFLAFLPPSWAQSSIRGVLPEAAEAPVLLYPLHSHSPHILGPPQVVLADEEGRFSFALPTEESAAYWLATRKKGWPLWLAPDDKLRLEWGDDDAPHAQGQGSLQAQVEALNHMLAQISADCEERWPCRAAALDNRLRHLDLYPKGYLRELARFRIGYALIEAESRLFHMEAVDSLEGVLLAHWNPAHDEADKFLRMMALNRISVTAFHASAPEGLMPADYLLSQLGRYPEGLQGPYLASGMDQIFANNWQSDNDFRALAILHDRDSLLHLRLLAAHSGVLADMLQPRYWMPDRYGERSPERWSPKLIYVTSYRSQSDLKALRELARGWGEDIGLMALQDYNNRPNYMVFLTGEEEEAYLFKHSEDGRAALQLGIEHSFPLLLDESGAILMQPAPLPDQGAEIFVPYVYGLHHE